MTNDERLVEHDEVFLAIAREYRAAVRAALGRGLGSLQELERTELSRPFTFHGSHTENEAPAEGGKDAK